MNTLLQTIFSMSLTGSVVILIVLLVRLLLRKSPKIFCYLLWGVVLFRLLCPVSFTSPLSFLGLAGQNRAVQSRTDIAEPIETQPFGTDIPAAAGPQSLQTEPSGIYDKWERAKTSEEIWWEIAAAIWVLGVLFMFGYMGYSFLCVKQLFLGGVHKGGNIYEIDWEVSPFVFGVIRPKICLPYWLNEQEREYVLLHERTHLKRGDHIIKLLAFFALSLHWFNPLVWLAFFLAEKDMEMSCDETVMSRMETDIRVSYATSLLNLSTGRKISALGAVTFGEGGIKVRIKNIMRYKKPTVHAILLAVFVIGICVVCLGSNPKDSKVTAAGIDSDAGQKNIPIGTAQTDNGAAVMADEQKIEDNIQEKNESQEGGAREIEKIEAVLQKWAEAFCGRDGKTIADMSSDGVKQGFMEREMLDIVEGGASFGWSSPWMMHGAEDYVILNATADTAEILYYAWTSEPHVTVWRETLEYHADGDSYIIDGEELRFGDNICTQEEFFAAYPFDIRGSRMDYMSNGAGQSLKDNALLSSNMLYRNLFAPETAAVALLNLLDNPNKVEASVIENDDTGIAVVEISFKEDGGILWITMKDNGGIWIPQSYEQKG